MHFLHNFDPETSARERRKLNRKNYFMNRKSKSVYNERGQLAATGKDLCDCLDDTCPGCHFPCAKCNSCKCGHECREAGILGKSHHRKQIEDILGNRQNKPEQNFIVAPLLLLSLSGGANINMNNRKWMYDKIEIEGNDFVIKNDYKHK